MDRSDPQENLEARIDRVEEIHRFTVDALEMAASLGDFQSSINRLWDSSAILTETGLRVRKLIPFQIVGFYLADEANSDFHLVHCEPEDTRESLAEEIDFLINNGTFAWALRENRPIRVSTRHFEAQVILQVMATRSRIRGLFAGILSSGERNIPEVSLSLLSIILLNSANALESYELYQMVQRSRNELEDRVKERTLKLIETNEKLQIEISERNRAEKAALKNEERFRDLFDHAPVGYYELDREGRFVNLNQTELEMMGYRLEEMMGQSVWKFNEDEETARKRVLDKLASIVPPAKGVEFTYRRKDGMTFPVLIEERILRDQTGKITGLRGTIQDITDRKRAEQELAFLQEQLRQAQKMEAIGQLAGGIAHDFNNILTVISGGCELTLLRLAERDPLREKIEEIHKAANRAASLTRQLLAFSRRQVLEFRVADLNGILTDLNKMLRRVIGENIELATLLGRDLRKVKIDLGQIEQLILNLVVNARDAMPDGGKLILETANVELDEAYARTHMEVKPGPYVRLSISDTGVGIAPEVKRRIFEPFFTTKEKGKGTGLGLSTVYGIAKQSGGSIEVYSELGQGTVFKIYLPQVDGPFDGSGGKTAEQEAPQGSETILLVEDEEEVRKLAAEFLREHGYTVLEAHHGNEASLICMRYPNSIHLMLTDVVMPGMNGRELAEHLIPLRPKMKVLYMSGYTDDTIVHHGVLEERVFFIHKPFSMMKLAKRVREVLDKDPNPVGSENEPLTRRDKFA